jgi:hypothetical protein
MSAVNVSVLLTTHFCLLAIVTTQCFLRLVVNTHIGNAQRSTGLAAFFFLWPCSSSRPGRQLPDGILPPWRAPVEDINNSALHKILAVVDIAVDVPCGMVAQNSVCDGVDDGTCLIPWVLLCRHCKQ